MARSKGRRRRARRSRVVKVVLAVVALAVAAVTIGALFLRTDPPAVVGAFAQGTARPERGGSAQGGDQRDAGGVSTASEEEKKQSKADVKASGPSKHTDTQAYAYFMWRWGANDAAIKRLTDIRTVGGYLRIYTDLPDTANNSKAAITLCQRGREYLTKELGRTDPVVFVQAEFGENGNPVLANLLGPDDTSCRVTHPAVSG